MPRMRVLSSVEQASFEKPPVFDSQQRKRYFDLTVTLERIATDLRTPTNRIGFVLSCGYFRATKQFFSPHAFHTRDIESVAQRLGVSMDAFQPGDYAERTRLRHEHLIVQTLGVSRFDADAAALMKAEIRNMIRAQLKPKLIFWRCIDVLHHRKIQLPNYRRLADLILGALNHRKRDLSAIIERELSPDTRELLESLFVQPTAGSLVQETS